MSKSERWENVLKSFGELVKELREKTVDKVEWDALATKYVGFLVDEEYKNYTLAAWCRMMLKLETYKIKYLAWVLGVPEDEITSEINKRNWADDLEEAYIEYLLNARATVKEACACDCKQYENEIEKLNNQVAGHQTLEKELLAEIEFLKKENYDLKIINMALGCQQVKPHTWRTPFEWGSDLKWEVKVGDDPNTKPITISHTNDTSKTSDFSGFTTKDIV